VLFSHNNKHNQKDIIVLLTRQQPPESTSSYAFQYVIGKILEETQISKKILDKCQIIAFPIMNPDEVDLSH
jgi:murein tripeptide amidase MpaA